MSKSRETKVQAIHLSHKSLTLLIIADFFALSCFMFDRALLQLREFNLTIQLYVYILTKLGHLRLTNQLP